MFSKRLGLGRQQETGSERHSGAPRRILGSGRHENKEVLGRLLSVVFILAEYTFCRSPFAILDITGRKHSGRCTGPEKPGSELREYSMDRAMHARSTASFGYTQDKFRAATIEGETSRSLGVFCRGRGRSDRR